MMETVFVLCEVGTEIRFILQWGSAQNLSFVIVI